LAFAFGHPSLSLTHTNTSLSLSFGNGIRQAVVEGGAEEMGDNSTASSSSGGDDEEEVVVAGGVLSDPHQLVVPEDMVCPIGLSLMTDPVIASDGITCSREALDRADD